MNIVIFIVQDKMFSFKYKGPERAANLLETALQKVK